MLQGGVDAQPLRAFHAGPGGQVGHGLEGLDEGRAAVGVAGVIERVDADEDV